MTDDPFLTLVTEALNLMHPRFAAGPGVRAAVREFYHQFRHLWDRAIPVKLGLGHLMVRDDPGPSPVPDFLVWHLGAHGRPDRPLGAVSLAPFSPPDAIDDALVTLRHFRTKHGYPHAVCGILGRAADLPASGLPEAPGVATVFFDTDRWQVVPA